MDPNSYDYPHPSSYSYPPDDGTTPLTPYNFGGIPTVPPPPLPPRRPQVLVRIAIVGALIILLGATIGAFALTRQPSSQSKMSASTSPQPGGSPSMTVTTSTQTVLSTATVSSAITATSDAATATPFPTATTIPPLTATLLYNNIGISSDDDPAMGNFNGVGDSYSAQALAQAGISPGQPVAYDQMSFIWPRWRLGSRIICCYRARIYRLPPHRGMHAWVSSDRRSSLHKPRLLPLCIPMGQHKPPPWD